MKFLVTGANGFVGKPLCAELLRQGQSVRAAVRAADAQVESIEVAAVGSIDGATDWRAALRGVEVVIHLAARVHVMRDDATNPLEAFRKVNVAGTEHLARCAATAGVKRLVYVSSVKVNGESTSPVGPSSLVKIPPGPPFAKGETMWAAFTETDTANPQDSYGISKWEAEQALHRVARETGLEVVIVRPPLVYGPGVKGNFAQMIRVLARGIPLPLASVHNLRSLVYIGNLVDALILCATHPAAAGQTYLVSDGEDVATPDLLRWLGENMARPARVFSCPPSLLRLVGRVVGKSAQIERLIGALCVDSGKLRRELGWQPPFGLREGLRLTVQSVASDVSKACRES
jgi:nucleoside-diphosphate-sugar epimerase